MSDKTKQLILKILIILGTCLLLMLFPLMIPVALLWPQIVDICFRIVLFAFLGDGTLLIICMCTFKISQLDDKKKSEKFSYPISKNESIEEHLHTVLISEEYIYKLLWSERDRGSINFYCKNTGLWKTSCFCVIRVGDISDEILAIANDFITDVLSEHGTKQINDTINMTLICCVDRINGTFNHLINEGVQQGIKNHRFIVGYSYGGQKCYIAPPKNSFAILQYKKLKREFLKMIGYQENE